MHSTDRSPHDVQAVTRRACLGFVHQDKAGLSPVRTGTSPPGPPSQRAPRGLSRGAEAGTGGGGRDDGTHLSSCVLATCLPRGPSGSPLRRLRCSGFMLTAGVAPWAGRAACADGQPAITVGHGPWRRMWSSQCLTQGSSTLTCPPSPKDCRACSMGTPMLTNRSCSLANPPSRHVCSLGAT